MPIPGLLPGFGGSIYLHTLLKSAKYAGTSSRTVSYWYYHGGDAGTGATRKERRKPLSYLQLVEMAFVATFRRLGVPLQRIRKAREYAAQVLRSEFPFAEYRWQTEGKYVLIDLKEIDQGADYGKLIIADAGGQVGWEPLVGERFAQFDYENGIALVWHVVGRTSPVLIDPRVSFGAPTVKGVPTWAIRGRYKAGESLVEIQADFQLEIEDVQRP